MSAADSKEVIYIDVDEEITSIVGKVQNSRKKIVALVLPKRAGVLQSIVNMKLLKKASDQNEKQVVLITSEARLLPLAGAAKIFVAPNLTSKPYIPPTPAGAEELAKDEPVSEDVPPDPETPVSDVAPDAKFADDEPLEIDNTPKPEDTPKAAAKPKKGKKKIPNFNSFRKKILIGAAVLILLIAVLIYAVTGAPNAKIILKTQSDDFATQVDFTADPNATELDTENKIIPAQTKQKEKEDSETVDATGEKNIGKKATGSASFNAGACSLKIPRAVASGTGLSINGVTFITQKTVSFKPDTSSGNCYYTGNSTITAQSPGEDGNVNNSSFSVSGRPDVSATGSASGGTDKIVKVVTQRDIDSAKERLNSKDSSVQDEMEKELKDAGYVVIPDATKATPGNYMPSTGIDGEADEVTVTVKVKYSVLGVKKDDLRKLIEEDLKEEKSGERQSLLNDGIDKGTFKISGANDQLSEGQVAINFQGTVVIGPDINQDDLRNELAGKKKGEAVDLLKSRPGILDPQVELSPFWVTSIPGKASKVTFEIQQADGSSINP